MISLSKLKNEKMHINEPPTEKNAIFSDPVTLLIRAGVTVEGRTTPSGKFNEDESNWVLAGDCEIWSEEIFDFFGIGERMAELVSSAGSGAVFGVSDWGGFVWTAGSAGIGSVGTSTARASVA